MAVLCRLSTWQRLTGSHTRQEASVKRPVWHSLTSLNGLEGKSWELGVDGRECLAEGKIWRRQVLAKR